MKTKIIKEIIIKTANALVCGGLTAELFRQIPPETQAKILENRGLTKAELPKVEKAIENVGENFALNEKAYELASEYHGNIKNFQVDAYGKMGKKLREINAKNMPENQKNISQEKAMGKTLEDIKNHQSNAEKKLKKDIYELFHGKIRKTLKYMLRKNNPEFIQEAVEDIVIAVAENVKDRIVKEGDVEKTKNRIINEKGIIEGYVSAKHLHHRIQKHFFKNHRDVFYKEGWFVYSKDASGADVLIPTRAYRFLYGKKETIMETDVQTKRYKHNGEILAKRFLEELAKSRSEDNQKTIRHLGKIGLNKFPEMIMGMRKGWEQIQNRQKNYYEWIYARESDDGEIY